jgi:hypothetical protein
VRDEQHRLAFALPDRQQLVLEQIAGLHVESAEWLVNRTSGSMRIQERQAFASRWHTRPRRRDASRGDDG